MIVKFVKMTNDFTSLRLPKPPLCGFFEFLSDIAGKPAISGLRAALGLSTIGQRDARIEVGRPRMFP
jgi:hypothetical protein